MTKKITQLFTLTLMTIAFTFLKGNAQTVYLLNQNFDSIKALHIDTIPHGWLSVKSVMMPHTVGVSPGWFVDTLRTNSSPSYSSGSGYGSIPDTNSSKDHIVLRNNLDTSGIYDLISPSMNTTGKTGITVSWGSRTTASFTGTGSTTATLYFSVDNGSTWDSVAYTRVTPDGAWHLTNNGTPITLPAKAENKASLILKWSCNIINGGSGTIRLDDILVKGTVGSSGSGINSVLDNNAFEIYPNPTSSKFIITSTLSGVNNLTILNAIGQTVRSINDCKFPVTIDRNNLNNGIYFLQITNQQNQLVAIKKLILE